MQSLYAHFKSSSFFPNRTSTLRAETCTPPSLSLSRSILPASQPSVSLSLVQEQALRSPLLSAMHYCDECVMGNTLTRGKGIKALKIVKRVRIVFNIGVVAANQRVKKPKLPLRKRVEGGKVELDFVVPPKLSSLVEIQHCLFSVLLIGCTIWWASHPAPEQVLPSILSSLNAECLANALNSTKAFDPLHIQPTSTSSHAPSVSEVQSTAGLASLAGQVLLSILLACAAAKGD